MFRKIFTKGTMLRNMGRAFSSLKNDNGGTNKEYIENMAWRIINEEFLNFTKNNISLSTHPYFRIYFNNPNLSTKQMKTALELFKNYKLILNTDEDPRNDKNLIIEKMMYGYTQLQEEYNSKEKAELEKEQEKTNNNEGGNTNDNGGGDPENSTIYGDKIYLAVFAAISAWAINELKKGYDACKTEEEKKEFCSSWGMIYTKGKSPDEIVQALLNNTCKETVKDLMLVFFNMPKETIIVDIVLEDEVKKHINKIKKLFPKKAPPKIKHWDISNLVYPQGFK